MFLLFQQCYSCGEQRQIHPIEYGTEGIVEMIREAEEWSDWKVIGKNDHICKKCFSKLDPKH